MPNPVLMFLAGVFLFLLGPAGASADEPRLSWPDKQGPFRNGHAAAEDCVNLPVSWSESDHSHIAWKIPLEGEGHGTPVIGLGKIWLTAANHEGTQQFLYVLDEQTGELLHHKLLFENVDPEPLANAVNTYASPSCVLEPDAVYAHFGTYGTARLDPQTAEVVWQRRDINGRHFRGPGSSPVIFEDLLILTMDCINQQYLIALDKQTGQTVWRTDRSTDYHDIEANGKPRGDGDYRKAYSTPTLFEVDGRMQLISAGSRAAFGYDARTGKEIWTITHPDFNSAARPLMLRDQTFFTTGSDGGVISVHVNATTQGNVDETHVAWRRPRGSANFCNPILVGDRLFMVSNRGVAVCLNAVSGEELWQERIGGLFCGSPIEANGLIYFPDEEGTTVVLRPGETCDVVSKNVLAEGMRASPAVSRGALFLRTFGHLYKIADTSP